MVAPCCDKIVCCHKGHDESRCPRKLDRSKVTTLVCCSCKQSQPIGKSCRACKKAFADVGCTTCRMWYAAGTGFHCKGCGVCRQGREQDVWHCAACDSCYPIRSMKDHKCTGSTGHHDCVLCGKDMHRSSKPSTTMSCGHRIHCCCFMKRVQVNFSCPSRGCGKTVANLEKWYRALDHIAAAEHAQSSSPVKIYCIDCRRTSTGSGNHKKCGKCGSYNTVRIPPSQQHSQFPLPPPNMPRR